MTSANGSGSQADARQLAALRKRTFAQAKKALEALTGEAAGHQDEFTAGDVPSGSQLRKLAEKYARLLETIDVVDSVLTPEALEALAADDVPEPEPGTVTVNRDALAMASEVIRDSGLLPGEPGPDTPLGQLFRAAGISCREMAAMASVPVPFASGPPWADDGSGGEYDAGWPPQSSDEM